MEKLVSGIPKVQAQHDGVFPGCASGKMTRGPFPSSENKTIDILHLIHSDICGLMHVHSISGYLYYITFINEFSRKTWIYYLKHKDEALETFKELKALVESQIGKKIKTFKSDVVENTCQKNLLSFVKRKVLRRK